MLVSCLSATSSVSAPTSDWGFPAWLKSNQPSRTLQSHWSGTGMHDVQVCKYWSKKLLEGYKTSGTSLEKNSWVPHNTCWFLVLEWLFSHLSKTVKTTDKKKNSKILNRHSLFFLLSFSGLVLQLHCRPTRHQKVSTDWKIHPSLTVIQLGTPAESHWVSGWNSAKKRKGHIMENANPFNSCMLKKRHEVAQGSAAALLRTAEAGVKRRSFKMMISSHKQTQQRWGEALNLWSPFKVWPHFQPIFTPTANLTLPT